jgi:hypothetical protein
VKNEIEKNLKNVFLTFFYPKKVCGNFWGVLFAGKCIPSPSKTRPRKAIRTVPANCPQAVSKFVFFIVIMKCT